MIGVGIVRAAYALFAGGLGAPSERELGLLAMYVGGFAAAGAVLGALWPLRSTRVGAYKLGYIGAAIVSSVCGRIVMEAEHDHDRGAFVSVVTIMTLVFGTAAGHQIRRED